MVWPKRKSLKTYFRGRVNQVRVIYRKITKKSDKSHAKKFIESVSKKSITVDAFRYNSRFLTLGKNLGNARK